jgi:hypothetical protein
MEKEERKGRRFVEGSQTIATVYARVGLRRMRLRRWQGRTKVVDL